MCGTAAAASSRSTVMRTSSEPARASAATCCAVALDVGGVGVGHRLDDDRRAAADRPRPGAVAARVPERRRAAAQDRKWCPAMAGSSLALDGKEAHGCAFKADGEKCHPRR